jgi:hypothetical protein
MDLLSDIRLASVRAGELGDNIVQGMASVELIGDVIDGSRRTDHRVLLLFPSTAVMRVAGASAPPSIARE